MSTALPSDEVAEDYKNSLDDLVSNDRYQISNLTLIAKENIEHAEAISRVLQNHIQRAPPARKLPALYVLDSIVKNVGSPYTVYFGRNLYQTFMHAYSQVDGMVRRKLEEMLKTWREPVPGSLSTTPVFPISSTQTIIDNLNKLRASAVTPVQRYQPTPPTARVGSVQPYRQTPTPPQQAPQYPVNPQMNVQSSSVHHIQNSQPQTNPYATTFSPYPRPTPSPQITNNVPFPVSQPRATPQSSIDIQKLHADIDDLTTDAKIECATHPMDAGAQRKLTTLQTLKEILDSGTASEGDLIDIRNSIMQEMAKKMAVKHQSMPTPQINYPTYVHPQQPLPALPPSSQPSLPFNSANLAELLRATSRSTHTPQPSYGSLPAQQLSGIGTPPVTHVTPVPQPVGELPLIAQLRASGLLSATPTPPQGITPPLAYSQMENSDVAFTSAAIKIPRPQLVTTFLNSRPNQCSTCGRRFTSDDAGREKKSRHLDWHFKTKARMIEAEKRGQNRSWYVDEREWIASREYDDDAGPADVIGAANGLSPSSANRRRVQDFVRAPTDPVLRTLPCPIDQEPFKSEWSEEVQDFIWKDAIQVGGRYYHASCYKEVTKERSRDTGGNTPLGAGIRTATPDSVLGKRKAEDISSSLKTKVKLEP